jgi:pectate lyase
MYDVFMYITARGNTYDNTTGSQDNGKGGSRDVDGQDFPVAAFTDATKYYSYTLDKAADVPAIVQKCAGPQ